MLKIGHRGAPFYAPENTLSSFRKAVSLGVGGIELDVHCCKSGEVVVIHDDTVDRTTNGKGCVSELTLAEIRALNVPEGEHIPTLSEVLEAVGMKVHYFIEVKKASDALTTAKIMQKYIAQGWRMDSLMMISFEHEALCQVRKAFPLLAIGASFEKLKPSSVEYVREMKAQAILPYYKELTGTFIPDAHAAGLKVIGWTVNEPKDITELCMMGVDGIISDYPDRLPDA